MRTTRANGGIAIALLVLSVALVGCSENVPESTASTSTTTIAEPSTTLSPTTTTTVVRETLPFEDVPPLAIYLAAIDRGLSATRYAGDVYLDPESFIATGRLFCSLLEAGVTPTGVLESYIAALEAESGDVDGDDLVLGGVVLGASVQIICPEYAEALEIEPSTDEVEP